MELTLIKVGGAIVENDESLGALLSRFAAIDTPKVLVHGGGRSATSMATRLGIPTRMVEGRRVTDADMLRVVTMVYAGLVNKTVVARLQALGINAIGLTGADLGIIRAHRRPPVGDLDYGFVGDIDSADSEALSRLLMTGATPVLAPLAYDGCGGLLNVNADTIASTAAVALARAGHDVTLTYCFERPGVLANPDDDSSVIPLITPTLRDSLAADGTLSGGMLPKVDNALAAVRCGVKRVLITSADDPEGLHGTSITA